MKKRLFPTLWFIAMGCAFSATAQNVTLKTFDDSVSYAVGCNIFHDMTRQWHAQQLGFNERIVVQAMADCVDGKEAWNDALSQSILMRYQQALNEKKRAELQENIEAGEKFLKKNSNNKSIYTTTSGLQYRMLKAGNGKRPSLHVGEAGKRPDRVKVHYTGKLINGKVFDSSVERGAPITFALDQVIAGWTEGLQLMDEGSKYMLYIPYKLGYGEHQAGDIPPGSALIFEVELLEINPEK